MNSFNQYKQDIQTCKKEFDNFVKSEGLEQIAEIAHNALSDREYTFLNHAIDTRGLPLQQHYLRKLQRISLLMDGTQEAVPLALDTLFHAGYSTMADIELQNDFSNKQDLISYIINTEVPHSERQNIGSLTIQYPKIINRDLYILLSSGGNMSPGNIENREHFRKSKSITDRLAYEVYCRDITTKLLTTCRQGDHKYHTGITGLADILSVTVRNYLIGKEKTIVSLYMTAEVDFIKREAHKYLNELLDDIIHVELIGNRRLEYSVVE